MKTIKTMLMLCLSVTLASACSAAPRVAADQKESVTLCMPYAVDHVTSVVEYTNPLSNVAEIAVVSNQIQSQLEITDELLTEVKGGPTFERWRYKEDRNFALLLFTPAANSFLQRFDSYHYLYGLSN